MRFGHGTKFGLENAPSFVERLWLGTPTWPKAFMGSSSGRIILSQEEDNQ